MSTPAAFDTTLLVPAALAGFQPSGPRSPWSPDRQVPRSIAPPIVELAEMEGGRTAIMAISRSACMDILTRDRNLKPTKHQCQHRTTVLGYRYNAHGHNPPDRMPPEYDEMPTVFFLPARPFPSAVFAVVRCPSVRPSHAGIVSKRRNLSENF